MPQTRFTETNISALVWPYWLFLPTIQLILNMQTQLSLGLHLSFMKLWIYLTVKPDLSLSSDKNAWTLGKSLNYTVINWPFKDSNSRFRSNSFNSRAPRTFKFLSKTTIKHSKGWFLIRTNLCPISPVTLKGHMEIKEYMMSTINQPNLAFNSSMSLIMQISTSLLYHLHKTKVVFSHKCKTHLAPHITTLNH